MADREINFNFATKGIKRVKKKLRDLQKGFRRARAGGGAFGATIAEMQQGAGDMSEVTAQVSNKTERFGQVLHGVKRAGGMVAGGLQRVGKRVDKLAGGLMTGTREAGKFRYELLSVMFFGMALQRVFMGLIKPAMKAVGLFEIWGAVLTMVFLPVALQVLDMLMPLFEWLMDLSKPVKKLIGWFAVIGTVLTTFLMVIGQVGLGLQGLMMMFSGLAPVIAFLTSPIGLLIAAFTALVGGVMLFNNLGEDSQNMITNLASKIKEFALKAVDKILGVIDKVIDGIVNTDWAEYWSNIFDVVSKVLNYLVDFLGKVWDKISEWYRNKDWEEIWENVYEMTGQLASKLSDFLGKWVNKIVDWAKGLDWTKVWGKLFEWTAGIHNKLARFLGQMVGAIVDFLTDIDWGEVWDTIVRGASGLMKALKSDVTGGGATDTNIFNEFLEGYNSQLADDFILTNGGKLIKTNPQDTIIGTKNPENMGGSGGGNTYNVTMNIEAGGADVDELKNRIGEEFVREIESRMRR